MGHHQCPSIIADVIMWVNTSVLIWVITNITMWVITNITMRVISNILMRVITNVGGLGSCRMRVITNAGHHQCRQVGHHQYCRRWCPMRDERCGTREPVESLAVCVVLSPILPSPMPERGPSLVIAGRRQRGSSPMSLSLSSRARH